MKKYIARNSYKIYFIASICLLIMIITLPRYYKNMIQEINEVSNVLNLNNNEINNSDFIYLSDIDYIESESKSGWGSLLKDKTSSNTKITVKVDGVANSFDKGMWAHASSLLIYDLSNYDYDFFTALIGLNTTSRAGNGVTFRIYTSMDKENWILHKESVKLPQENAELVKIDIKGKKYLKLEAYDNGANGQDHSVYADAKLTKESYEESLEAISIEKYDEKIKNYGEVNVNNKEQELTLLQRDLIKNAGEFTIKRFIGESEENKEAFNWLFNDVENLRLYIMGGKPAGNYYNSFSVLKRLLETHKSDFEIQELTKYGNKYGDLYKRMAITLSLTHSAQVALWMQPGAPENQSDAVTRYEIYKELHKNNKMKVREDIDITKWFESYNIEEMRFVMNNLIDDESIVWLNEYVQSKIDAAPNSAWGLLTPHPYMAYVWPNYGNPVYYAEENYDYFNDLFSVNGKKLYDYGITRGTEDKKIYKVWMNFRNKFNTGAVCGGISKTGSNIRATHGIPAAVIGQPGHAAIIYYTQDAQGNGYWNIDNDVSGWAYSEKGERMLLGWGNESYQRGYSVVYMALAQEVLNDFETFEASQKKVILADVYQDNLEKKERIYREALETQPLNINAWYGLIMTYNANSNKTEKEYFALAEEIAEKMKYFPLPMYHLTNLIKPKMTTSENIYQFTLLQTRMLTEGTKVPNNTEDNYYVYQPSLTRLEANHLLGNLDKTIATFSFDGEDKGKIVLSSRFDNNGIRWDYSLDGGNNWKEVAFTAEEEHKLQLSEAEIASITEEQDIKIHIVGVDYEEKNIYTIDITKAVIPNTLYGNDLENRVIGINTTYEWRRNENEAWTSYQDASPDNTGNKTLQVRIKASGTVLPSEISEFTFTADNQPDTEKYIRISHLSVHEYSTQSVDSKRPFYAPNAIDGNINTIWHTDFRYSVAGQDPKPFITIKLDEPKYLSALEFVQTQYRADDPDFIKNGIAYVSMDGENWTEAGRIENCAQDTTFKKISFAESIYGQYIKLEMEAHSIFVSASMINLYEDITKQEIVAPSAGIGYDKTELTNQNVLARLINPSTNITITNNVGSDTYVFTKNGEFTFEFEDDYGHKGSSTAVVNWIDKEAPTATIEYSTTNLINRDVIARLVPNEAITVLNNGELDLTDPNKDPLSYTFAENGEFTFEFQDLAGNIGTATAKVSWIDKEIPDATVEYSTMELTNEDVTVTVEFDEENVRILNNNGSNTYTFSENGEFVFEYMDAAGNIGSTTTHVEWIDKEAPNATIIYNTTDLTNQNVVASVRFDKANVSITNNNGSDSYTFVENGEFTFEYMDAAGNTGSIKATVNWIDKQKPNVTIEYNTTEKTNQNVTATLISDKNIIILNNVSNTYTFTENGEFTFEYVDAAGNAGTIKATVNWIDKIAPKTDIIYSTKQLTNKNVTVELVADEEIIVLNNNGLKTYTFEENGEFTFEYRDIAGNTGTIKANVNWIDKVAPTGTLSYDKTNITNENVTATISFNKENVTITNNEGKNTYTFTENGEFTFEYQDALGNKNTTTAMVDWIDKEAPVAKVTYSNLSSTREPVTATIEFDKEVTITNNNGSNIYTFTENGEFTFEYVDAAGNTGSTTVRVDWINKEIANAIITYDKTTLINEDVTATVEFDKENVTIINNDGLNTYTFTKNGEFIFEYVDAAGNVGRAIARVTWIDKEKPTAKFNFNLKELTNQDVVVEILPNEPVTILNNEGSTKYTFKENGNFTFEFQDLAGNIGTATVTVFWIDKVAPVATITYDRNTLTNKDVTASITFDKENVTITNNNTLKTHTFKENGEFTFEYRDAAGNTGESTATVNWIDKVAPTGSFQYNITELTNKDVIAEILPSEDVIILNNNGSAKYTFKENGKFTFELMDKAGNIGTAVAEVNWIDKIAPVANIRYSISKLTNQNVVAEIYASEEIKITNNKGLTTHTFTENGEFTFEYEDKLGNVGRTTARVTWIDKKMPNGILSYDIKTATNKNVTVTITFDKTNVEILNNNGSNKYTFKENGEFTFDFRDAAGNVNHKTATVSWINKELPTPTITYDINDLTNKNVTATITFDKENVKILNNNGSNKYTFKENGEFTFEFQDATGNIGTAVAKVDWIDKAVPVAKITYNKTELTNEDIIASITFDKENVKILNNNGSSKYTFQENGEFVFEFKDAAGNTGTMKAKVDWIDKVAPVAKITYDKTELTDQDVIASVTFDKEDVTIINNDGLNTYTFQENGEFIFEYQDKAGNTGTIKAIVNWIKKEKPIAKITYDKTKLTNEDVIATIELKEGVKLLNNEGKTTYTFKENGEFVFKFKDAAGNIGTIKAVVDWIDKKAPIATIIYDKTKKTNGSVIAAITFDETDVKILNNNGLNKYTFKENGEFVFEFQDAAGNTGSAKAIVNWIEKTIEKPVITPEKKTESQIIIKKAPTYDYSNQEKLTKYTDFTIPNMKASILTSDNLDHIILKRDDLELSRTLKQKFGEDSEYFELYAEDALGEDKKISTDSIKLIINTNNTKEFAGIYVVKTGNVYEKLNYKVPGTNQIEIDTKSFGRFLLDYKEEVEEQIKEEENVEETQEHTNNIVWYTITVTVLVLGAILGILIKKK